MDDLQAALLLLATVPGLAAAAREQTLAALLAEDSQADAVLTALIDGRPEALPGWSRHGQAAQELRSGAGLQRSRVVAEQCRLAGISIVFRGTAQYPFRLTDLEEPPPVLYVKGSEDALQEHAGWVAMVGSRKVSQLGARFARRSAEELASAGLTVVSGLAIGTDAAVHQGALDATGRTVAVLASGVDQFTPRSNAQLGRRIIRGGGAAVSEYPPGTPVRRWAFPNRNRIIAALAVVVIILEAELGSGSTLTGEAALELDRSVFVMPGRPGDQATAGGLDLLAHQNVKVFRNSGDVLPYFPGVVQQRVPSGPGAELLRLAELMAEHLPCRTDRLPELLGLTDQVPVLLGSINLLKMHRIVHEDSAGNLNLVTELPRRTDVR